MSNFNKLSCLAALAAVLAVGTGLVPGARADNVVDAPDGATIGGGGQEYACTNVAPTQTDPRWTDNPLTIVTAPGEGAYLGDVRATVTDETGAVLFDVWCQAPMFTADLPSGER